MKLRLRSLETKETLKIEVPTPCSLQRLKEIVAQRVSASSSSSSAAASVLRLSLNRNDELLAPSPQDSLQSLGITSGDLIFFTLNPNGFSPQTLIPPCNNSNFPQPNSTNPQNSQPNSTLDQTLVLNTQNQQTLDSETEGMNTQKEETLDSEADKAENKAIGLGSQIVENQGVYGTDNMDVDDDDDDDGSVVEVGKSFSVPCFLRKVFRKEVGEGGGGDRKLLVIAVHAVLLESGFVGFNSVTRTKVEGFHLPDEWPSSSFTVSLWYTLPEIIDQGPSVNGVETVLLNFRSLGKYINVYGSLANNGAGTYRVCLDEDRLAFFLNVMWANCNSVDETNGNGSLSHLYPEREVFEFWRTVKDRLALPLLIDLCEKAGLAPPPCFMRLPTDLKLKIVEGLPGIDVAKVGCVCSELRYLSSTDDLWKQKFVEQFGDAEGSQGGSHWKEKFAKSWETRKRRKIAISEPSTWRGYMFAPRIIRDPDPLRVPRIIGGDYDIGPPDFPLGRTVRARPRRRVIPFCNLGGYRT